MSYRLAHELHDPETGKKHLLVLAGGLWNGDVLVCEFAVLSLGLSGRIECDWRGAGPNYVLDQGVVTTDEQRRVIEQVTWILRPFFQGTFVGIRDDELAKLYPSDYHQGSGYCDAESPVEKEVKGAIADLLLKAVQPKKVLDAGCAGGLLVRELRQRGVDAHGFDHCPDLTNIVVPDVAPFVREGALTRIPYGPEDGFDTLVCIDVFEHIPEDRVPAMVAEFDRLGVKNLAVHISHTEIEHFGHITMRPLSWWDQQLGSSFRRSQAPHAELLAIPRPWDPKRVLRIYQRVEKPVALQPRATAAPPAGVPGVSPCVPS